MLALLRIVFKLEVHRASRVMNQLLKKSYHPANNDLRLFSLTIIKMYPCNSCLCRLTEGHGFQQGHLGSDDIEITSSPGRASICPLCSRQ